MDDPVLPNLVAAGFMAVVFTLGVLLAATLVGYHLFFRLYTGELAGKTWVRKGLWGKKRFPSQRHLQELLSEDCEGDPLETLGLD